MRHTLRLSGRPGRAPVPEDEPATPAGDQTWRLATIVAAQREIAELELDLEAALERVVERTREVTRADGACLYFAEGDELVVRVSSGLAEQLPRLPLEGSLAGSSFRSGALETCHDLDRDPRIAKAVRRSADVRSLILVPLTAESAPRALLSVIYSRPDGFDDEDVEAARLMAEFAAAALRNAAELETKRSLAVALAESEQRFRSAIDSSPLGFALCTPDDRYILVNDAFCRIVGRTRAELEHTTWRDITHPDDIPNGEELGRRVIAGVLPHYEMEHRMIRGDGETVWVRTSLSLVRNVQNQPFFGVVQLQDVTEQRLLEQSLRERERLFRALFDQSLMAKLLFDDSHTIVDANAAACALAGMERHELLGHSIDGFAADDVDFDPFWNELEEQGTVDGETAIVLRDGARRTVVFSSRAAVQPGLHLAVVQDVTEQRALEERLRQGQKMEAVGRLAGGIAHDFNNMLTAIGGFADLLLTGTQPGTEQHRYAGQIAGAAQRAATLTRQLLAFSRRQVLQPAPVDLNEVVDHTRGMVTRLIGEDIALETSLAPSTEPVLADAGQLEQVIVNLAVNARDAMPRGGRLLIETDTVNIDPDQAREAVAIAGRYTRLTISDTGVGMDEEQLRRLFEPFYSTKGDRGVGLGLATVYGIVRQSGGFVTVHSEPGAGTTFRILLPVTGLAAERLSDQAAQDPATAPSGSETVLLVEDEEVVRSIVTEMLEESGYEVVTARDGQEALRVAERRETPIDLLITDVVMPEMSGQDVASRVTQRWPKVRTLFVSGYTESAVTNHGVLAPGTYFLGKPFSADDLARKVREILDTAPVT